MHRPLPAPAGLGLAMVAGLALAVQSRITGTMGLRLGDGVAAALLSFGSGLLLMILLTLGTRAGRSGLAALRGGLARRVLPRWYLVAGAIGASLVFAQGSPSGWWAWPSSPSPWWPGRRSAGYWSTGSDSAPAGGGA